MKIKEVLHAIELHAPIALQESYDNCGVQIGDINQEARGAMLCIDVTESVLDEAVALGCNLIIAHHPLVFKPFKSLTGCSYIERCMIKACKHDLVIYAAHTNLDNSYNGINLFLAKMLGLQNVRTLDPQKGKLLKLVTFVPHNHADMVRDALFNAGAGNVGNYNSCSYNIAGKGSFRAQNGAKPFCGEVGEFHFEDETRIETILPAFKKGDVLRALLASHPYEEPAYDIYCLENAWSQVGSGIVGTLPDESDEEDFLYLLKDTFRLKTIQHSAFRYKPVRDIAICSGSGAFLLPKAIQYGADVFITGEAKYNDFYDVEDKLLLATIGHHESEVCSKNIFYNIITEKFPTFGVYLSGADINPVNYL